jgi:hypothetical protein
MELDFGMGGTNYRTAWHLGAEYSFLLVVLGKSILQCDNLHKCIKEKYRYCYFQKM